LSKKTKVGGKLGLVSLFILALMASSFAGAWLENRSRGSLDNQKLVVSSQSNLISHIAKSVGPSVVSVNVDITSTGLSPTEVDVFGQPLPQTQQAQAAGTGIIISPDGLIMTNRHVVPEGTTKVSITLSDGTELKNVSVIGRTAGSDSLDIAFLKINDAEGHGLKAAVLGDSSLAQVGDGVVAIGNALGQFQNTVTSGIISGYGRDVQAGDSSGSSGSAESLVNLFQTDAAINQGNSGGPLVNMDGQVIGINTAVASQSQSIGFAIPVNDAKGMIGQVLKTGKFARPYLGVRYVELTGDVAKQYGLAAKDGAFILPTSNPNSPSVIPDSPAATVGLQEKDVIAAIDGKKVDQTHSLTSLLSQYQPGDKVELTILRGDKTVRLDVKLGTLPGSQ